MRISECNKDAMVCCIMLRNTMLWLTLLQPNQEVDWLKVHGCCLCTKGLTAVVICSVTACARLILKVPALFPTVAHR